jgi:type II secretory pathway pseudopilin PulG
LLELVVVLALMGLATALVAPAGFRSIQTWRRASAMDAALGAMAALGTQARAQGHAISFERGRVPAGAVRGLPDGWTIELSEPLVVRVNGSCSGTRGALRSGGYVRRFALTAPFCRVELDGPVAK